MNIHWLTRITQLDAIKSVNLASIRLRAGVLVNDQTTYGWNLSVGEELTESVDVLVVGKIGTWKIEDKHKLWINTISRAKLNGAKIVIDYTDNHLSLKTKMAPFYKDTLKLADFFVCSSKSLKTSLEQYWGGEIAVIEDAIEIEDVSPKEFLHQPITILWFGHFSNLSYLINFINNFFSNYKKNIKIIILTNEEGAKWLLQQEIPEHLKIDIRLWSVSSMIAAAQESDLCIIPSDPENPIKAGVSANRLITALALGLPTAADMLSSYIEFHEYFIDIKSKKFFELLDNPLAFSNLVSMAQNEVVPRFSQSKIAEKWFNFFSEVKNEIR